MKLFCRKYGSGPPLIILHGLYGSSDNWVTIAKQISNSFTVYLPDQRNHGQSPHSTVHDYNAMRDDLYELAKELKLDKFFLVGHSMGGKTAISFALEWPEMLSGLLIGDISPFADEKSNKIAYNQHYTILKSIISTDLSSAASREEVRKSLSEKITSEKITGFIMKNLERASENKFRWKLNADSLFENLDRIMEGIDRNAFMSQQITGFPVIFLKGEYSEYIPDGDVPDIKKVFPAAEIITITGAGHWIHADNPEEVIRNIKRLVE